jgi:predicted RNase H-like HicB family nuclease
MAMDVPIAVAVISASAAVIVPAFSFYLTKKKERQADWQRYKFELYKDLVQSLSVVAGTDSTSEGRRRFALACNTLHLIAPTDVLDALHNFQDETSVSNSSPTAHKHDQLLSRLLWEIRKDLRIPRNPDVTDFNARLWCSRSDSAVLHKEQDIYVTECPEVGTVSQGKSAEEAVANLKEATELYLEEFPSANSVRPQG